MKRVRLKPNKCHGEWNYVIHPRGEYLSLLLIAAVLSMTTWALLEQIEQAGRKKPEVSVPRLPAYAASVQLNESKWKRHFPK